MLIGIRKYIKKKVHKQYTHYCVLLCNLANKAEVLCMHAHHNNNKKCLKINIGSDAMHISCCKMVKARKWTFFHSQRIA
jgi:hypothetical protein